MVMYTRERTVVRTKYGETVDFWLEVELQEGSVLNSFFIYCYDGCADIRDYTKIKVESYGF